MRFITRCSPALAGLTLVAALSACGPGASDVVVTSPGGATVSAGSKPGSVTDGVDGITADGLAEALDAVFAEIGTDDPDLLDVTLAEADGLIVTVQAVDPDAPDELNQWVYSPQGTIGASVPVDYGGDRAALDQNVFAASELDTAAVEAFAGAAVEESGIEDATVASLTIKRGVDPASLEPGMLAAVRSDRDSVVVYGDLAGAVTRVVRG